MCRATIEEVATDNTWHHISVSTFNTLPLPFSCYIILRNCREVITIATRRVYHILNIVIIFYTFLFLQYSILNQEKDYKSQKAKLHLNITSLRYIILNVAFIYINIIIYKLSHCKFKLQKNITFYHLSAVQIIFPRFYLSMPYI